MRRRSTSSADHLCGGGGGRWDARRRGRACAGAARAALHGSRGALRGRVQRIHCLSRLNGALIDCAHLLRPRWRGMPSVRRLRLCLRALLLRGIPSTPRLRRSAPARPSTGRLRLGLRLGRSLPRLFRIPLRLQLVGACLLDRSLLGALWPVQRDRIGELVLRLERHDPISHVLVYTCEQLGDRRLDHRLLRPRTRHGLRRRDTRRVDAPWPRGGLRCLDLRVPPRRICARRPSVRRTELSRGRHGGVWQRHAVKCCLGAMGGGRCNVSPRVRDGQRFARLWLGRSV